MLRRVHCVQLKFDAGSCLGAFEKLRKATISFVMCLSVRMEQLPEFHEI
jgi:hypothetical protein